MALFREKRTVNDLFGFDWQTGWEEKGSTDMRTRAYERWTTLLNQYEPPPIDEATDEALQAFIVKRKEELPDAWY